jgi:hypothetical protein
MLTLTYFFPITTTTTNYILFFINGLPGGIDYILLTLVKFGKIKKIVEKSINSKLNIWIRSPGIMMGAYIVLTQYIEGVLTIHWLPITFCCMGLYWNAQYFTERVVFNFGYVSNKKTNGVLTDNNKH